MKIITSQQSSESIWTIFKRTNQVFTLPSIPLYNPTQFGPFMQTDLGSDQHIKKHRKTSLILQTRPIFYRRDMNVDVLVKLIFGDEPRLSPAVGLDVSLNNRKNPSSSSSSFYKESFQWVTRIRRIQAASLLLGNVCIFLAMATCSKRLLSV